MGREFRNKFPTDPKVVDMSNPSNFCKIQPGLYENFTVSPEGVISISSKAYPDDVVAFVLGCISSNPTISDDLKLHLAKFLDGMDKRAVDRHGYSNSEVEKNFTWVNVENSYSN